MKLQRFGMLAWIAVTVVLLPVLYVASVGPAGTLMLYGVMSRETYSRLYNPVWLAAKESPVAWEALGWYVDMWPRKQKTHCAE